MQATWWQQSKRHRGPVTSPPRSSVGVSWDLLLAIVERAWLLILDSQLTSKILQTCSSCIILWLCCWPGHMLPHFLNSAFRDLSSRKDTELCSPPLLSWTLFNPKELLPPGAKGPPENKKQKYHGTMEGEGAYCLWGGHDTMLFPRGLPLPSGVAATAAYF